MSKANVKPIGTKEVLFFERNGTNIDISKLGLGEPYFRELSGHSFQRNSNNAKSSQAGEVDPVLWTVGSPV